MATSSILSLKKPSSSPGPSIPRNWAIPESSFEKGRSGEDQVAHLLVSEGWSVLARNFRWRRGEIDLIAALAPVLCFIEVKTWTALGADQLSKAIGAEKRRRIVETAKIFLVQHREYNDWSLRFDVFLVGGESQIKRFPSAFTGEL